MYKLLLCAAILLSGCGLKTYETEEVEKQKKLCLDNGGRFNAWTSSHSEGKITGFQCNY